MLNFIEFFFCICVVLPCLSLVSEYLNTMYPPSRKLKKNKRKKNEKFSLKFTFKNYYLTDTAMHDATVQVQESIKLHSYYCLTRLSVSCFISPYNTLKGVVFRTIHVPLIGYCNYPFRNCYLSSACIFLFKLLLSFQKMIHKAYLCSVILHMCWAILFMSSQGTPMKVLLVNTFSFSVQHISIINTFHQPTSCWYNVWNHLLCNTLITNFTWTIQTYFKSYIKTLLLKLVWGSRNLIHYKTP